MRTKKEKKKYLIRSFVMIEVLSLKEEVGCLVVQKILLAVSKQKLLHLGVTSNLEMSRFPILYVH